MNNIIIKIGRNPKSNDIIRFGVQLERNVENCLDIRADILYNQINRRKNITVHPAPFLMAELLQKILWDSGDSYE